MNRFQTLLSSSISGTTSCALFFILEGDHLSLLLNNAHSPGWFMVGTHGLLARHNPQQLDSARHVVGCRLTQETRV